MTRPVMENNNRTSTSRNLSVMIVPADLDIGRCFFKNKLFMKSFALEGNINENGTEDMLIVRHSKKDIPHPISSRKYFHLMTAKYANGTRSSIEIIKLVILILRSISIIPFVSNCLEIR